MSYFTDCEVKIKIASDGMKTIPQNTVPFVLRGLPPLDKLDQSIMRKLRKLADRTGSTVEALIQEGILEFAAKCQTEKELGTRIIPFPVQLPSSSSRRSNSKGEDAVPGKPDPNRLPWENLKESRWLRAVTRLKTKELAAEVKRTRRLGTKLGQRRGSACSPP
jgi:hypothetical protein